MRLGPLVSFHLTCGFFVRPTRLAGSRILLCFHLCAACLCLHLARKTTGSELTAGRAGQESLSLGLSPGKPSRASRLEGAVTECKLRLPEYCDTLKLLGRLEYLMLLFLELALWFSLGQPWLPRTRKPVPHSATLPWHADRVHGTRLKLMLHG